jgi:Bacterial membrane protein YfhO
VMAVYRTMQARLAFAKGERWGAYYQIEDLRSPVIGLMNTRFAITGARLDERRLAGSPFRELTSIPGGYIYENQAVLPRFFLVSRLRPARSLEEAAALLKSPDFDPQHEAIVEGGPGPAPPAGEPAGMVSVSEYGLQQVRLSVESERPAYLVTSETHYPGWRAWVDGRPQPIYYTNVAFRGLPVPAGRHQVFMRFEAPLFWRAATASGLGWVVWAWLLAVRGRRPRG